MRFKRPVATMAAGTALTLAALVGGPTAAHADADPATVADVPDCIDVDLWNDGRHAHIVNTCDSSYRIKVKWNWASDSGCLTVGAGSFADSWRSWPASYAGIVRC